MTTRLLAPNNVNAGISDLARHAFETCSKTFYAKILQKIVCASMQLLPQGSSDVNNNTPRFFPVCVLAK